MKTNGAVSIILIILFLLVCTFPADAGFTVTPMHLHFNVKAGEQGDLYVKVTNQADKPVTIRGHLKDYSVDREGKPHELEAGTEERSCSKWLLVSPALFTLGAKEEKRVRATLTLPEGVNGTYWAYLFFEQVSKPEPRIQKKGAATFSLFVKQRWQISVKEAVPGTAEKRGQISDMNLALHANNSPEINVEFTNNGNVILSCRGQVQIRGGDGKTVDTFQLAKGEGFMVYPDGKRLVSGTVSKKLPPGDYIALAIVDYGGEELVAGEMEFEVK